MVCLAGYSEMDEAIVDGWQSGRVTLTCINSSEEGPICYCGFC